MSEDEVVGEFLLCGCEQEERDGRIERYVDDQARMFCLSIAPTLRNPREVQQTQRFRSVDGARGDRACSSYQPDVCRP